MAVALLSVYDKTGIEEFAKGLTDLGWQIYASGGTAKVLREAGVAVKDVAELVGGDAILGHRVVTLSREIAAGLLADKQNPADLDELKALNLPVIDLVCVDMYPLEEAINKPGSTKQEVIEQTDIGGPTLLHAAAKGRRIVLSVAKQRKQVLEWLAAGQPDEEAMLDQLAARAEYEAARYILASAKYLGGDWVSGFAAMQVSPTKYGENPWQTPAALYTDNRNVDDPLTIDKFEHVQGMERSFINFTDIDRLLQTVTHIAAGFELNFKEVPSIAVGVKHGNACGAAVSDNPVEAIKKMLEGDTRAIFGGVVMINGAIDEAAAQTLMHPAMAGDKPRLLDGVIGSSVTKEALELLSRHKLRVVMNPALANLSQQSLDRSRRLRPVRGGVLEQPNYNFVIDLKADYIQQHGEANDQQNRDLVLAWAVGSTSNSNTISLVKDGQLIGNGVGQQDRVGAAQLALSRVTEANKSKINAAAAYSDSFFPFPDGPELLAKSGIKAILTSSGSVGDDAVIKTLTEANVSLVMVPDKIGRGFYMH